MTTRPPRSLSRASARGDTTASPAHPVPPQGDKREKGVAASEKKNDPFQFFFFSYLLFLLFSFFFLHRISLCDTQTAFFSFGYRDFRTRGFGERALTSFPHHYCFGLGRKQKPTTTTILFYYYVLQHRGGGRQKCTGPRGQLSNKKTKNQNFVVVVIPPGGNARDKKLHRYAGQKTKMVIQSWIGSRKSDGGSEGKDTHFGVQGVSTTLYCTPGQVVTRGSLPGCQICTFLGKGGGGFRVR